MRIAIYGSGGVGGYFGGRLAQAGEQVVFIARGEHLRALRERGLRVDSIKGDFHIHPIEASDDPRQVGEVDCILLALKAWQVPEAALAMRPMVGDQSTVIPLNNGVEAPEQLSVALGGGHVMGGLCRISSFIAAPGHIRHVGIEPYVAFGEMDGSRSQRGERLRRIFEHAGVAVEIPEDIRSAMWGKFIFIAAISGLGAVTRAPLGVVRETPGTRQMLIEAVEEIVRLAEAKGIGISGDMVAQTMALIDGLPPEVTASMQRDIMEAKPSELESQNGAVVRMSQEIGVSAPVNAFIYNSLLPQEMSARGKVAL
jgi:2-dehydropantoate 2-reductase